MRRYNYFYSIRLTNGLYFSTLKANRVNEIRKMFFNEMTLKVSVADKTISPYPYVGDEIEFDKCDPMTNR